MKNTTTTSPLANSSPHKPSPIKSTYPDSSSPDSTSPTKDDIKRAFIAIAQTVAEILHD